MIPFGNSQSRNQLDPTFHHLASTLSEEDLSSRNNLDTATEWKNVFSEKFIDLYYNNLISELHGCPKGSISSNARHSRVLADVCRSLLAGDKFLVCDI